MLIDSPGASGVMVTESAERLELKPPPFDCERGSSSVSPRTVTLHGGMGEVEGGACNALQVPASFLRLGLDARFAQSL